MASWPWSFGTQPTGNINASKLDDNFNAAMFGAGGATVDGTFALWSGTAGNILRAGGFSFTFTSNYASANVALNAVSSYFTAATVAQGTTGTWLAFGGVTVQEGAVAGGRVWVKLWDGATVIDSREATVQGGSSDICNLFLGGFITSPAGNLRLDVRSPDSSTGAILFNATGNSKDSGINAIRLT